MHDTLFMKCILIVKNFLYKYSFRKQRKFEKLNPVAQVDRKLKCLCAYAKGTLRCFVTPFKNFFAMKCEVILKPFAFWNILCRLPLKFFSLRICPYN